MAFINFLKKSKKKEDPKKSILDAPPPPPIPELSKDLSPFPPPQLKEVPKIPPLEEMPEFPTHPKPEPMEKASPPLIEPKPFHFEPKEIEPTAEKEGPVFSKHEIETPPETLYGYPPIHEPKIYEEQEMEEPPLPHKKTPIEHKKPKVDVFSREYREALEERERTTPTKPVYITIHQFRRVIEKTNDIKTKVKESDETLSRLTEIEKNKDNEFDKWSRALREVQRKCIFVDKKLFELE